MAHEPSNTGAPVAEERRAGGWPKLRADRGELVTLSSLSSSEPPPCGRHQPSSQSAASRRIARTLPCSPIARRPWIVNFGARIVNLHRPRTADREASACLHNLHRVEAHATLRAARSLAATALQQPLGSCRRLSRGVCKPCCAQTMSEPKRSGVLRPSHTQHTRGTGAGALYIIVRTGDERNRYVWGSQSLLRF
eukprot:COSAG01_NODE_16534_length_1228_cov_233.652790_2_plen_194_part_00